MMGGVAVVCAPDDGWWYHLKHVEKFPEKINSVTLHFVGYMLEQNIIQELRILLYELLFLWGDYNVLLSHCRILNSERSSSHCLPIICGMLPN